MRKIIENQVLPLIPNLIELKETANSSLNFGKYINILERDINNISETVGIRTKVKDFIEEKNLESIDIIGFLHEYYDDGGGYFAYSWWKSCIGYKIYFECDNTPYTDEADTEPYNKSGAFFDSNHRIKRYILANKYLLTVLFDNLIQNAEKHAFENSEDNLVFIQFLYLGDEIRITVSNTGKLFPENYTFEDFSRKGSKTGTNSGEGLGGWYINEIVRKLNGRICGPYGGWNDYPTTFDINFPIIEIDSDENI